MPSVTTDPTLKENIREILADMQSQEPIHWGPPGNKARAVYAAARMGHTYDSKCKDCEPDLLTVLKWAVK